MLAVIGACLTMLGAVGAGGCICLERKNRIAQLSVFMQAFSMMAGEIAYSRISLPEVFSEVGSRMEESDGLGEVFGRLGRRLCDGKGQDIRTIWGEEMGRYLLRTRLSAGEKEMILSFPSAVWYLDGQRQQAAVEAFAQRFMEEAKRARQAQKEENRITMAVSIACGAFAAILLA
ncbi:MAG: hypothetical protein DBX58_03005 [Clostridiales bacterium]|nr:MAG: hypothetical protein DBX58_03005 [Clostridiales bacterium]HJA30087.1 stage III sporulation protein AB [Candidatus Eisenbergiella pullicola]